MFPDAELPTALVFAKGEPQSGHLNLSTPFTYKQIHLTTPEAELSMLRNKA